MTVSRAWKFGGTFQGQALRNESEACHTSVFFLSSVPEKWRYFAPGITGKSGRCCLSLSGSRTVALGERPARSLPFPSHLTCHGAEANRVKLPPRITSPSHWKAPEPLVYQPPNPMSLGCWKHPPPVKGPLFFRSWGGGFTVGRGGRSSRASKRNVGLPRIKREPGCHAWQALNAATETHDLSLSWLCGSGEHLTGPCESSLALNGAPARYGR